MGQAAVRQGFPIALPGMRVGLLGGSFDPAHAGHAHITREALRRFGLDRVWWLVSPGNPLKPHGPAPMARRLEMARRVMSDPRVEITDIETRLGTRHTAALLGKLLPLYPGVRFVWLMGADNLAGFHKWDRWSQIMRNVPLGVLARPGCGMDARVSPVARAFSANRVPPYMARCLPDMAAPAWCFVNIPMLAVSSTALRAEGGWG